MSCFGFTLVYRLSEVTKRVSLSEYLSHRASDPKLRRAWLAGMGKAKSAKKPVSLAGGKVYQPKDDWGKR